MTEITTTPEGIPVITADPFSLEILADPHALHEQMREDSPVRWAAFRWPSLRLLLHKLT